MAPSADPTPASADSGRMVSSAPEIKPGETIGGYQVARLLRRSMSGDTYLATHRSGLSVEVRLLPHRTQRDRTASRRISREIEALMALRHRNIVRVWAVGNDRDREYLAIEHIPGATLAEWLERLGQIDPRDAVHTHIEVLQALIEVHRNGMIHRDVKPGSIILSDEGRVVLTDFMLARRVPDGGDGSFIETNELDDAYYKAPEQIDGAVDHRTDLYSVGVSLYHCLAGRLPFDGFGVNAVLARCEQPPIPLQSRAPHVLPTLAMVVMKLIEPEPRDRFPDAVAAAQALALAMEG